MTYVKFQKLELLSGQGMNKRPDYDTTHPNPSKSVYPSTHSSNFNSSPPEMPFCTISVRNSEGNLCSTSEEGAQIPLPTFQELLQTDKQSSQGASILSQATDFLQTTHEVIPADKNLFREMHFPIGCIVRPMNDIPVDTASQVNRCTVCGCYMNPYARFFNAGWSWECPVCYTINETAQGYHVVLGMDGKRIDAKDRVELCKESYEIVAPAEYMDRPPQKRAYVFVFEVSNEVNVAEIFKIVKAIQVIIGEKSQECISVSFLTFGKFVQVYDLKLGITQQLPALSDICLSPQSAEDDIGCSDVELPSPIGNYFVRPSDAESALSSAMEYIGTLSSEEPASAFGTALVVSTKLLEMSGGRIITFTSSTALKSDKYTGVNKSLKTVDSDSFIVAATKISSKTNICIDTILLTNLLASVPRDISQFSYKTGGEFFVIQPTELERDINATIEQIVRPNYVLEAVLRIRSTKGLSVSDYFGGTFPLSSDLHTIGSCGMHRSFAFVLKYDEDELKQQYVILQSALLYTNTQRERRIRVHTKRLLVTNNVQKIYEGLNAISIVNIWARVAAHSTLKALRKPVLRALDSFGNAVNFFYLSYRRLVGKVHAGQLRLPYSLRNCPLLLCALCNSDAFESEGNQEFVNVNQLMQILRILTSDTDAFIAQTYPMLIHPSKGLLPLSSASILVDSQQLFLLRYQNMISLITFINEPCSASSKEMQSVNALVKWFMESNKTFPRSHFEKLTFTSTHAASQILPNKQWFMDYHKETVNLYTLVDYVCSRVESLQRA